MRRPAVHRTWAALLVEAGHCDKPIRSQFGLFAPAGTPRRDRHNSPEKSHASSTIRRFASAISWRSVWSLP
jgi:hypothetical protein